LCDDLILTQSLVFSYFILIFLQKFYAKMDCFMRFLLPKSPSFHNIFFVFITNQSF